MTDADRQAFAELMLGLGETFGEPVSDARMEIYFAALADLELADVRVAATAAVRGSSFFPRPAEIRELIAGKAEDRAEFAWLALVKIVRGFGYYREPERSDWPDEQLRRAALELFGGWKSLCAQLPAAGTPEFLGTAKQFKSLYAAAARREACLPPLETGRELSAGEASTALANLKGQLQKRGLPTGAL